MPSKKVTVIRATLDEHEGDVVLRGVITADSLRALNTPAYQREVLDDNKINRLMNAHRVGTVPDVELNMRGQRLNESDGGVIELLDPVYIVDGLQRITSGIRVMSVPEDPAMPYIGAVIHIGRDEVWEKQRFEILNLDRTKLSPNVTLRNQKDDNPALQQLYRLCANNTFVLKGRVQWTQAAKKSDLITATTFVKTVGKLHGHLGPGSGSDVRSLAVGLEKIVENIGTRVFVANVQTFFDIIEECWGVSNVEYRNGIGATVIKTNFLFTLARVLSSHEDFWAEDGRLQVAAPMANKLKRFAITDPTIATLAGSGGPAADMLYDLLVQHLNKGRRTGHLRPRGRSNAKASDLAVKEVSA